MSTSKKTSIALAAGAALTAGLAFSSLASADANPFASAELSSGYMQLAEHHGEEGKCGEAKCGEDAKKDGEGKCGEAKCGEDVKKDGGAKSGEDAEKDSE
ncbi:MAG: low-complexity protein [Methylophaga sp.]|nr:low-complexity protein [Methylophaga sp.]